MSTDVYIDTDNEQRDPFEGDCIRIGHLGTLAQLEYNLLGCLRIISGTFPTINKVVIAVVPAVFDYFRAANAKLCEETTPEWRAAAYCYAQGWEPDWEDVLTGEEVVLFLQKNRGRYWQLRVD